VILATLSSAKIKNAWSYTSTFPYVLMAWFLVEHKIGLHDVYLVKHRDVTFYFTLPYYF